jgi:hypothetical protein
MIGNGAGTLVTTGTERTARSPAGRMRLADQLRHGFTDADSMRCCVWFASAGIAVGERCAHGMNRNPRYEAREEQS